MGYRIFVVICMSIFVAGCAATDSSSGYEGDVVTAPGKSVGANTGYYSGTMVLESNACESIADEVGVESKLGIDVIHDADTINAEFDAGETVGGKVTDDSVVLATDVMGVKHIYYLTFAEGEVTGNCEVVEADDEGQYGDPCAVYTISLQKGEKPASDLEDGGDVAE